MKKVESPANDSLRRRYLFKVIANSVGLVGNVIIQALVPRSLGPRAFGDFNFLTHFFTQLLEFVDGRSSTGAIVKISLRPNESGLVVYYAYFSVLMSALVLGLVWIANTTGFGDALWPGQGQKFIYLGALWAIFVWLSGILHKVCDAHGLTVSAEKARTFQKTLGAAIILAMYWFEGITLEAFFIYYLGLLAFVAGQFYYILSRSNRWPSATQWILPIRKIKAYFVEYYQYSLPLLMFIGVEAFALIFDRWLLQSAKGSEGQGYFGFAFQIGQMSFLFAGAMSPLIQREFSRAYALRDIESMAQMFRRYFPLLFTIAAYFACFTVFQADNIIELFAGNKYGASYWPIVIISFFPIYQAYGQLLGSVFFATEKNQLFRNIGVLVFLFGAIISYVLVAPIKWFGLGLGAIGLAAKMVFVQVIFVNILLYYNCKMLQQSYRSFLIKQARTIGGLLLLAFVARWVTGYLFSDEGAYLIRFLFAGLTYTVLVFLLFLTMPRFLGVPKSDFAAIWREVLTNMRGVNLALETPSPAVKLTDNSMLRVNSEQTRISPHLVRKRYKILLLGAKSSIHAVKWVNGLAECGHEVHLVSMHDGKTELHPGVTVHHFPSRLPVGYLLNVFKLRKLLKALKPDILHAHYASGYGTMATLSGFRPTVLSVWGSDVFSFPYQSVLNYFIMAYNLKKSDWICSTSNIMAQQVLSLHGNVRQKMSITPFGVDLEKFNISPIKKSTDKIVVGTVKTLLHKYGIDVFIRGFAEAMVLLKEKNFERIDDIELLIVGSGSQRDQLENLTHRLGIGSRTEFAGYVVNDRVPDFLNRLDIYVAVSREESFGVAILEASACCKPTIVSDVGGLKEVVDDGVTGFIVPTENSTALAEKIVELVENCDLREKMGEAGRKMVEKRYSWDKSILKMEKVYSRIVSKHESKFN